jgi:hypothetical protein
MTRHRSLPDYFWELSMRILILLSLIVAGFCSVTSHVQAQELKKAWNDYFGPRPITYSPSDPVNRSYTFNKHTGHAGVYYNCDGEEAKRNSPYICWKPHFEADFPECRGLGAQVKQDWDRMRQRICDGAGDCCNSCQTESGCQCTECTGTVMQQPETYYAEQRTTIANPQGLNSAQRPIASQSLMARLNATAGRRTQSDSGGLVSTSDIAEGTIAERGTIAAAYARLPAKASCDCEKCKASTAKLYDKNITTSRR